MPDRALTRALPGQLWRRGVVALCLAAGATTSWGEAGEWPLAAMPEAVVAWPAAGTIEYEVLYGKMGFRIGSAVHRWSRDGDAYRMESEARASGLLAAIGSLSYTQRSEGEVTRWGLRPDAFEVERGGRRREWSDFDWERGEVDLYRDGKVKQAAIHPGDQDVLTLWHQIALAEPWAGEITLTVVTGKSAAPSRLEYLPDEAVDVPAGRFESRHLRAAALDGSLTLEVWLAKDKALLPVRILMVDRKGEILDQRAQRIRIGDSASKGAAR
ncbi:MAG: DUF3108 domain-containing protein [Rhodocyclaceae bacterium]|nr:DUF3108 domain-containing protein [Rhodocyclaceae bacterium]